GRELLLFAGATLRSGEAAARTVFNNSVGLLSSVGRIAYFRSGGGSVASGSNWSHKRSGTAHTDSATDASSSSSSRINDPFGLHGSYHTIDGLAGLGTKSSNHSGGSNRAGGGGIGSAGTTSSASGSHGSGGGAATGANKANTGTKIASAAN